jgi:hypothetical protein
VKGAAGLSLSVCLCLCLCLCLWSVAVAVAVSCVSHFVGNRRYQHLSLYMLSLYMCAGVRLRVCSCVSLACDVSLPPSLPLTHSRSLYDESEVSKIEVYGLGFRKTSDRRGCGCGDDKM